MIIGLTGPLGSGKGVIAAHLQELGFKYYSLSNTVREEAKLRNIKFTRENLQKLGNLLREEFGVGVWAIKTMEKIDICGYLQNFSSGFCRCFFRVLPYSLLAWAKRSGEAWQASAEGGSAYGGKPLQPRQRPWDGMVNAQ